MGLLLKEKRGPAWKQGWAENTLSSMSLPPLPLLAICSIIFTLLYLSSYSNYKHQMQNSAVNLKLYLLCLPVILIFLVVCISKTESFMFPQTKAQYYGSSPTTTSPPTWDLPWGVLVLVVLLLLMVSYHSSFKSMWSPVVYKV